MWKLRKISWDNGFTALWWNQIRARVEKWTCWAGPYLHAFTVCSATYLWEDLEYVIGEVGINGDVVEVVNNGVVWFIFEFWYHGEFDVNSKSNFSSNLCNTSDNICAVNGGSITSLLLIFSVFNKSVMCASIIAMNCLCLF